MLSRHEVTVEKRKKLQQNQAQGGWSSSSTGWDEIWKSVLWSDVTRSELSVHMDAAFA